MDAAKQAQGSISISAAKAADTTRHPILELLSNIEQMVRMYGTVELARTADGKIDVRCGGVATYSHSLRSAMQLRVDVETSRVTDKIVGQNEAAGQSFYSGTKWSGEEIKEMLKAKP